MLSVVEHCVTAPRLCRLKLPSRTSVVAWRAPLPAHEPKRGVHKERCMACAYPSQWYCIVGKLQFWEKGRICALGTG